MRILITNDDGINASGIKKLVNWAKKHGDVTVVAPKVEQSGKSQAIELHKPFEVKASNVFPGIEAYTVDSTPADCVRYAIIGLKKDFDLVLSGINNGYNIGVDLIYSGTVGAVFEAELFGAYAIAFSTDYVNSSVTDEQLDIAYNCIVENKLFKYSRIYNVNIPPEGKEIRFTRQGSRYYSDNFMKTDDDMYSPSGFLAYQKKDDLTKDTHAVSAGYISVSPLTVNRINEKAYSKIIKL